MATSVQPAGSHSLSTNETKMALEGFADIASAWGLSIEEQINLLGSPPRSTFFKWRKEGGTLPRDTEERLSHLLNIYRVLQILFPNPEDADRWIREPNAHFGGKPALKRALGGFSDLIEVRRYLDAQRG